MIHVAPPSAREAYISGQLAELRGGGSQVTPIQGGYVINGRPYVALPCRCAHAGCPGYAMVHDAPADRDYFKRLFQRTRP